MKEITNNTNIVNNNYFNYILILLQDFSVRQSHICNLALKGQLLANQNLCVLSATRNKCHFSRLTESIPSSALVFRDSLGSSQFSSNSASFTSYRGLRGFPSNRIHYENQDRITRRNSEVSVAAKSTLEGNLKAADPPVENTNSSESEPVQKLTLYQRFKKTYKEHGKVLVAVHLLTSTVWFGSFYTLARCGFDIVPYLENWNFSEKVIAPFRSGGLGDVALAYLLYKLATPARYTVTIGGTNLAIKYLRKEGKIPQVPKEDSIRSLYREGKEDLKRRSNARMKRLGRRNRNNK
ncbi:unnamed protein product [Candidula unifasciata]|uniref:DUF1279 domain-containing protein n=1 Tax=Candidula unifasciata TaxID=100452 RepID=A0A8S3Z278_9EUPU|nr:unnamed protein product [Candidula unifasciata]